MQEDLLKMKEDMIKQELKFTKQIQELEIKNSTLIAENADISVNFYL